MKKLFNYILIFLLVTSSFSCHFISSFTGETNNDDIMLSFDKSKASVSMGAMDIINLTASQNQNSASISWSYDESIISAKTDNYSAVITGLEPGTTTVTARCGSNSVSCVVTVSEDTYAVKVTNPYVYASQDYVCVKPNETVKLSAALFGGTVADINGYTWSLDKSSVASLTTEGNYCWITGLNDGIAKLTVKHNKAAYGYSVLVNCSSDGTNLCYITTSDNIITINLSESDSADFSVDLMNSPFSDYASGFTFSIVDSLGSALSNAPVSISNSGNLSVSLSANKVGECYVKCTHPSASYSLEILVRVIQNAETSYIEPSQTTVTVSDSGYENISVSLMNYSNTVDSSLFEWSFSENADEYIEYELLNGNSENTGDNINIKGKKTGSVKITVSYPGVSSRNIIVLVRNIETEASDATCFITTSQNYIRMKTSGEAEQINIYLKNADFDDIENLKWKITNIATDGSNSKVINWKSGNGTSVSSSSRAVISNTVSAYAIIEPLVPGTAYIDISHPKAIYSTRITVVVTETEFSTNEKSYLNFVSSPIIYIKNGEESTLKVSFSGSGNADDIEWTSDGTLTLAENGTQCVITAPISSSGSSKTTVTASHPNADYPLNFTVICYDTEEELSEYSVKSIYSYQSHETIKTNNEVKLYLETLGLSDAEKSSISWNITEGEKYVSLSTENSNKTAIVKGISVGKAIIVASFASCDDVTFIIDVKDEGIIDDEKDCYLSTSSNVLYFSDINESQTFTVDLYNIDSVSYSLLEYSLSNNDFDVSSNGNSATITSLTSNGSATLTITHPLSQNELVVYLKTGNQYEYINEDSCYISLNQDVFNLYAGQDEVSLVATLNHTEQSDDSSVAKGFSFECEDTSIAEISYVNYSNTCYIKPIKNGTTKIIITHPDSDFEKEAVIIVDNAPNSSTIPYITTSTNVITMVQGNYSTATVSLMNCDSIDSSLWTWTSLDSRIADVVANNGTSAMICANSAGTVEIKVSHKECLYSLKILVVVLDSSVVTSRPYISTSSNIITIQKGHSETLTAEMIGGNGDSDSNYFRFQASSSATILVNSSSNSAYIKALNAGMAYITVYNSRYSDSYSKTVLVVVEDSQEDGIYIKMSQNIVKIKPNETSLTKISATLVNGEATDGEDFIWWADDYNLLGITTVAEQCSITPTGKSGTTKIHVKHAKAAKQADVLVMISDYDNFAFSTTSANISAEKLYFYPLQIPAMEESFEVKYSSSNEDVCIIKGSNSVAWVCGLSYGNASLTAQMVSSDGTVLATCEMLVSVTVTDPTMPIVSLGDSILTVEAGTSRVISGIISGDGIESTEKYNLKWSVKNKAKGISILDESADKTAYGSDIYVNFDLGGEYVLVCEHEASGAYAELYIIVEEKGEIGIELSSDLETVYKDDGSFSLTATLTNATDSDYKNIEWSAIKVGGVNIVAVSKAKGATCTVTPKSEGQTTVIAKLPNGKTASCIVIVKSNVEIHFDVTTVHVIPGYTETINYTTNPENATINWITQMTTGSSTSFSSVTNYFSIENDSVKKQLHITGLKDYSSGVAGTVTATMVGASSANLPTLKVYVEYNVEVRLEDMNGNNLTLLKNDNPDTANVKKFNVIYYPTDLEIDIKKGSQIISCISSDGNSPTHSETVKETSEISIGDISKSLITENGVEKVCMTVSVVPHTECDFDISVCGTLPSDTSGTYSEEKSFVYNAYYPEYDIELIDLTDENAFTKFKKDSSGNIDRLTLSDGEEAIFYLKIKNENAKGHIVPLTKDSWNPVGTSTIDSRYSDDAKPGNTRLDYAQNFFNAISTVNDIYKNVKQRDESSNPRNSGMIYLSADNSAIENVTVYHLSHAWDYYKDLPDIVKGDGNKWNDYKKEHNYDDDFIENLEKDGVDYWLVTAELEYNGKYAVAHPGKQTFVANWSNGVISQQIPKAFHYTYVYCGYTEFKFDNDLIAYIQNGFINYKNSFNYSYGVENGNANADIDLDEYTKTCIPYVIKTNELLSNKALVRPRGYSPIGYKVSDGWFGWTDNFGEKADYKRKVQTLINNYISPTVSKDTNVAKNLGSGTLTIKYVDGHGLERTDKIKTINVDIEQRLCEAYTNKNWEKETVSGYDHWYLSKELFDSSTVGSQKPYFKISNDNVFTTVSAIHSDNSNSLFVDYEVYPSDATITVTTPDGSLYLKSGSYSSKSGNTYTITQHDSTSNGLASGTLKFCSSATSDYTGTVSIVTKGTNLSKSKQIFFNITSDDNFVPSITSKYATNSSSNVSNYSYVDAGKRLIVVGDGETITGKISNANTYSTSSASYSYEQYSSSTTYTADTTLDQSGKKQSELVNVSVNRDGSFTIKHIKDYGYFATDSGTVDEFYSTQLYFTSSPSDTSDAIDAKRRVLNDSKKEYVSDNSEKSMSSYVAPYSYKDNEYITESTTYDFTPVGRILVTLDNDTTQEIIVGVKITENPCSESSTYGYAVPSSYYMNVEPKYTYEDDAK